VVLKDHRDALIAVYPFQDTTDVGSEYALQRSA
jgi:hypothetical protein